MKRTVVLVKGMHCRSCELLVERNLEKVSGIKNITVNYRKGITEFDLNYPATMEQVQNAIKNAGYEIGNDRKTWISKNPAEYKDLGLALLILVILYFIAKKFGLVNINAGSTNNPSNLLVVLIVGLTAGVSTCMALVGGLILGISARHSEKHPEATPLQKFRPQLFFNLGRIGSYFLLGGIIGVLGKAFQLSSPILGVLMIIVGLVMLILGIQLTELFPMVSSASFTLPSFIAKIFGLRSHHEKEYSHVNSLITGALTFFLPCGFTQAMQLYAMSTGNFFSGAAIMGVFALGTAPGLLGIGGLTSIVKGAFAKKFFKFAGLLVIFLALLNISNGLNLTGFGVFSFRGGSATAKNDPNVTIENGVQIVQMVQDSRGYKPNKFTIRKGIPTKWVIDSKDASSCAGSLVATKISIKRFLKFGENIITFTPNETGEIKFSCSMGMYTGKFIVVENDLPSVGETQAPIENSQTNNSAVSEPSKDTQVIKANFVATNANSTTDLQPNEFTVSVGKPIRFEIYAEVDGQGCMSTITIPRLADSPQFLEKGKTVIFDFTPKTKGDYVITCAMGAIRGKIIVN